MIELEWSFDPSEFEAGPVTVAAIGTDAAGNSFADSIEVEVVPPLTGVVTPAALSGVATATVTGGAAGEQAGSAIARVSWDYVQVGGRIFMWWPRKQVSTETRMSPGCQQRPRATMTSLGYDWDNFRIEAEGRVFTGGLPTDVRFERLFGFQGDFGIASLDAFPVEQVAAGFQFACPTNLIRVRMVATNALGTDVSDAMTMEPPCYDT